MFELILRGQGFSHLGDGWNLGLQHLGFGFQRSGLAVEDRDCFRFSVLV